MSSKSSALEERLHRYQAPLEEAIRHRTDETRARPHEQGLITVERIDIPDRARWPRTLVGTSIAVALVVVAAAIYVRSTSPQTTSPSASTPVVETPPASSVSDTAVPTTIPGATAMPPCPAGTETIGVGTLYLGQPGSASNLAADGFIFSLPSGTEPAEVALKAVSSAVIGLDCGVTAVPPATNGDPVIVLVDPPAVPSQLRIAVDVSATSGAVGVTRIHTLKTTFDVDTSAQVPILTLTQNRAPTATRAQIRFKKGDDVWELSASPTDGTQVSLAVPAGETDRFPSAPVEWVLFTLLDANDRVVGVGGSIA